MIKGSCCCGAVQFELADLPKLMGTCHCSRCRKVGMSVMVFVTRDSFRLISGKDKITTYDAAPAYKYDRTFCRICGTALGEIGSNEKTFPIAANCLDDEPGIRNGFHEFTSEKPAWIDICDDAPQFQKHPPQPDN